MDLHFEKYQVKPYIEPPHRCDINDGRDPRWAKGYRATIQFKNIRYLLDARWTPDHGNEVGIVKVNKRGKEIGCWEVFPIKEISEQGLEDFIACFDWGTMGGTKR